MWESSQAAGFHRRSAGGGDSALRGRVALGIVALLLHLTLPFLHSLEVHARTGTWTAAEASSAATLALRSPSGASVAQAISPSPPPAHDPRTCPTCIELSHLHAATADAFVGIAAPPERAAPVAVHQPSAPPLADVASPDARAPPLAPPTAVS
jgi:hypothetical protein